MPAAIIMWAISAFSGSTRGGSNPTRSPSAATRPSLGERAGPGFGYDQVPGVIETLVDTYLDQRRPGEPFLQTYRRIGIAPFREALYATA